MAKKMRVLLIASESVPYAATGGLADVTEALPIALKDNNIIVNKVMPKYKGIEEKFPLKKKFSFVVELCSNIKEVDVYHLKEDGVNTYFIGNDYYFERDEMYGYDDDGERFGFFSKAALQMNMILNFKPDIIHLNDWQTGMVSFYLKRAYANLDFYKDTKVLYTIHNLKYQGVFDRSILYFLGLSDDYFHHEGIEYYGRVCFMKAGIVYSDLVSTVSKTYSKEIQTENFGYGLHGLLSKYSDKITGILNGIYYDKYDPKTDEMLDFNYDIKNFSKIRPKQKAAMQQLAGLPVKDVPLIGVVTRLAEQKGIDLIIAAMEKFVSKDVQFVVLGSGDKRYEDKLVQLSKQYPDKISVNIKYDGKYARKIYASSDFFLMPSQFEPCGLSQLYSLRYGAIPVVRSTGGLRDTIVDYSEDVNNGTGFTFEDYSESEFIATIEKALELYENKDELKRVIKRAMKQEFSWTEAAKKYVSLYKEMLG